VALFVPRGTKLSQQHRDSLRQLKHLSELHSGEVFTARDVARLTELVSLRQLCLRNCPLDDESLDPLSKLVDLLVLDLAGCELTDRGLQKLHSLSHLTAINVQNTDVRTLGLQQLRAAYQRLRLPLTRGESSICRIVG